MKYSVFTPLLPVLLWNQNYSNFKKSHGPQMLYYLSSLERGTQQLAVTKHKHCVSLENDLFIQSFTEDKRLHQAIKILMRSLPLK